MEKGNLVDLIVGYRARNNLTIKEMAEKCGVSWLTLWNIENGKHKLLRTTERKILNVIENEVL
jgi:DNA-binding XRE family transcriptional regulator